MPAQNNLTLTDIEFLRAVEELNNNPKKHRNTDIGEMPANTTSIRKNTDLTQEQVKYRMGGNGNSRGFETETEERPQIIISHSAKPTDKGFGPRSVELTSEGQEILKKAEETVSKITNVTRVINETKNMDDGDLSARVKRNEVVNAIKNDLNYNVDLKTDADGDTDIDPGPLLVVIQADKPELYSGLWYENSSNEFIVSYYISSANEPQDSTSFDADTSPIKIAEALCGVTAEDVSTET
jgi:hypothetical protein